jgi:hypothetical protein
MSIKIIYCCLVGGERRREEEWTLMQELVVAHAHRRFVRVKGGIDKVVLFYRSLSVLVGSRLTIDDMALGL